MSYVQTSRQSEQGFTLVELAIVMVIIGLLIGGILKGQELIANAKISSTVSQLKGLDAAFNTFYDKYTGVPGDLVSPNTRLPGCAAAPCNKAGNGDSKISTPAFGTFPNNTQEAAVAFAHLSAADLVSGIDTVGNSATFGKVLPSVKAGGGMWVSYATANINNTGVTSGHHYAILNGSNAAVGNATGSIPASAAAQIDRKMDDGRPQAGSVSTTGTGCVTGTAANAAYNEAGNGGTCAMYVRMYN